MSTGWTDRQTENHMNKQTSIACLDRQMNRQTDERTNQSSCCYCGMGNSRFLWTDVGQCRHQRCHHINRTQSTTNAANAIITSTRGRHTCGCWLPVATVCYQCQSYSKVVQLQLGNANNEEFLLFTLSNGRSVGWIALDRIVLWHCSIAPSLDYFWYFKWCTYVNAYGSRRSIVHKHPWKCERTFSRTLGVCLVMECSPQNDIQNGKEIKKYFVYLK